MPKATVGIHIFLRGALAASLILGLTAGASPGFHDAESIVCSKCHTMHYSEGGAEPSTSANGALNDGVGGPRKYLLYKNYTDLCLTCHTEGQGAPSVYSPSGSPSVLKPGGDFYYSKTTSPGYGKAFGHNPGGILGLDDSFSANGNVAPGGTFPTSQLSCISCHDPHGDPDKTDGYRLLLYKPGDWTGDNLEVVGVPNSLGGSESQTNRPRYIGGFSAWCGACHSHPDDTGGGFHGSLPTDPDVGNGLDWIRHPTDVAMGILASNYGTTPSYLLPIQDTNFNSRVDSGDQVFCLSCHRAHATPYRNALRWDPAAPSTGTAGCNPCHKVGV